MWKNADPVQTHMEGTLLEEGVCVVAVEVTRAVQEVAREGAAFRRMEAAVAMHLVVDEGATWHREAVDNLRLHDLLMKHCKRHEPFDYQPREGSNPLTSLFTPDLDPRYQFSKTPSCRFQYDLLTLPLSSIASAVKMACRLHPVTILLFSMAALVICYSAVAKIPRSAQVCRLRRCLCGACPYVHDQG